MEIEELVADVDDPEERLEALARRAGSAYRREAPADGVTRLVDRRRRQRVVRSAVAVTATAGLVGLATLVADSNDDGSSKVVADTVVKPTVPDTTPAPTISSPPLVISADDQWGLDYTGGVRAVATGEPLRIGFVSDGDWNFEAGLRGGVFFVNTKLGGAGGRPLEIVRCEAIPGDAASVAACEEQLTEGGDLLAVTAGGGVSPVDLLVPNLNRMAPVVVPFLGSSFLVPRNDDIAGPFEIGTNVWAETQAMVQATKLFDPAPDRVTLLGLSASELESRIEAAIPGIDIVPADLPITGDFSAESIEATLRSTPRALESGGLVVLRGPTCGPLTVALDALGLEPETVVLDGCLLDAEAAGTLANRGVEIAPPNWIMMSSRFDPTDPLAMGFRAGVFQQGKFTGSGLIRVDGGGFGVAMVIARLVNEMDSKNPTGNALRVALAEFHGPVPLQYGPLECGELAPLGQPVPMACSQYMGAFKVVDGEWVVIANGANGKLIGLNGLVDVPT